MSNKYYDEFSSDNDLHTSTISFGELMSQLTGRHYKHPIIHDDNQNKDDFYEKIKLERDK
jgi:hypothetical protein